MAIGDGDRDTDTAQCRFRVGGHIVSTFQGVLVCRVVLWRQTVEDCLHVHSHIGIAVFVDAQSAAGVLCEDVHDARLWQLWQLAHDFARYQVEASSFRLQGYFNLLYHRSCICCFNGKGHKP